RPPSVAADVTVSPQRTQLNVSVRTGRFLWVDTRGTPCRITGKRAARKRRAGLANGQRRPFTDEVTERRGARGAVRVINSPAFQGVPPAVTRTWTSGSVTSPGQAPPPNFSR